jgi:hypothetical protein
VLVGHAAAQAAAELGLTSSTSHSLSSEGHTPASPASLTAEGLFFSVKRLMGRQFADVASLAARLPYKARYTGALLVKQGRHNSDTALSAGLVAES